MSTSLRVALKEKFDNVCFVTLIFSLHDGKMRFSVSSQIPIPEKSVFGHLDVFFLNVQIFIRAGVVFSCYHTQRTVVSLEDEFSGLSQNEIIQFPAKVPILAIFDHLGPPSKSIFSTYRQNFENP